MSILGKRSTRNVVVTGENGERIQNPYFAEVEFQIGDMDLSVLPPKHILSFNFEKNTDSSKGDYNKFTIQLFDETGIEIETRLAEGVRDCLLRYGYSGGSKTSLYSATITNYSVEFNSTGHIIVLIEGISNGIATMGIPKTGTYKNGDIHDHIDTIAKEEGWEIGYIEPCETVYDDEGKQKVYTRINSDAVTFITTVLAPEAKSKSTGQSGYLLYFEDKEDKTYVYFCTPNWDNETEKAIGTDELSIDEDNESYTFTIGGDKRNTTVLSFKPEYNAMLNEVAGGKEVVASTVDPMRNEMYSISVKGSTTSKSSRGGTREMASTKDYKAVLNTSSCSYDELRNLALNMLYNNSNQSYPATLIIVGNPTIFPQRNCNITVKLASGFVHHSSGEYLITGVKDEISGGTFTTTLSLIKSGLTIGVESGTVTENSGYVGNTGNGNGYNENSGYGYNNSGYTNAGISNAEYASNYGGKVVANTGGNALNSNAYVNSVKVGTTRNNPLGMTLEGGYAIDGNRAGVSGNTGTAGTYNTDIIRVAIGELGFKEARDSYGNGDNNTKYGIYTGTNYQPWCAAFVAWCANQAGIPSTLIPKTASCDVSMNFFKNQGRFGARGSYTPMEGDIIFFGSAGDSTHTGIVEGCKDGRVYTIEGNSSDQVIRRNYSLGDSKIIGYGSPKYDFLTTNTNFNEGASIPTIGEASDYSSGTSFSIAESVGDHSDEDFKYLAAVISSEAYETSYDGMCGVGWVIINRLNDSRFPNTIKEIVSQKGQFCSPWSSYLNNPKKGASEVAMQVLKGTAPNPIGSCLFFLMASSTKRKGINVGGNLFFESW